MTPRRAVFLDRDGTLVEDPGFLKNPDDVRILPGAGQGIILQTVDPPRVTHW